MKNFFDEKIMIAGGYGMVGSAIYRSFAKFNMSSLKKKKFLGPIDKN